MNERAEPTYMGNLTFDRVTLAIGGYDTGFGFQYSIYGIGNPDVGKRIIIDGSEYPTATGLQEGTMVSELSFSFVEKSARAFIEKGARIYISWDDSILGTRNDPAIKCLLQHLIIEKQTVEKAITHTMRESKPTPIDNSTLLYYPFGAGELIIGK